MENSEGKPKDKALNKDSSNKKEAITAESVKNAHATGDGAVQKTDELLSKEDENKSPTDSNPY